MYLFVGFDLFAQDSDIRVLYDFECAILYVDICLTKMIFNHVPTLSRDPLVHADLYPRSNLHRSALAIRSSELFPFLRFVFHLSSSIPRIILGTRGTDLRKRATG